MRPRLPRDVHSFGVKLHMPGWMQILRETHSKFLMIIIGKCQPIHSKTRSSRHSFFICDRISLSQALQEALQRAIFGQWYTRPGPCRRRRRAAMQKRRSSGTEPEAGVDDCPKEDKTQALTAVRLLDEAFGESDLDIIFHALQSSEAVQGVKQLVEGI